MQVMEPAKAAHEIVFCIRAKLTVRKVEPTKWQRPEHLKSTRHEPRSGAVGHLHVRAALNKRGERAEMAAAHIEEPELRTKKRDERR
mmetsp:Transcript_57216/g.131341  ORF Transcript_57216/g.131341 Transcript_57216/m.131341 type:complete len:87 (-) Transcript_57216:21-281(-)